MAIGVTLQNFYSMTRQCNAHTAIPCNTLQHIFFSELLLALHAIRALYLLGILKSQVYSHFCVVQFVAG